MNVSEPIRSAIIANGTITSLLTAYAGSFPVFTRRPVPADAPYPMIIISDDVSIGDEDGINDYRLVVVRDVAVYGLNEPHTNYRNVETIGYELRNMFHRIKDAIIVSGYGVIDIIASGPRSAPADSDNEVGRLVTLTIRLSKN